MTGMSFKNENVSYKSDWNLTILEDGKLLNSYKKYTVQYEKWKEAC